MTTKKNIWEQTLKVRKIESLKYEECEMKVTGYFLVECCEFFYLRKTDKKYMYKVNVHRTCKLIAITGSRIFTFIYSFHNRRILP